MKDLRLALFALIGYTPAPPSRFKRPYPPMAYTWLGPLSVRLQGWLYERNVFWHNAIRDECTKGFECCSPECRAATISKPNGPWTRSGAEALAESASELAQSFKKLGDSIRNHPN